MKPVELVYERFGVESEYPILILHGFLASSRNWRTVAKRLAENHHVYVLDMRNHGASPHAERMDYPVMAEDISSFLDSHGLQKVHLLGHSMGGKVAMWFALHNPERVEKLIVADIAPVTYNHSFDVILHALRQLPLEQVNNRKQAEQFLLDAIPDMGFRQFLLQNLVLQNGVYSWRINLDIILQNAHHVVGFPESVNRVYLDKALFVAGEHSAYIEPDAVLKLFPQANIVEIADTGHWLYVEAPDAFSKVVEGWVSAR